MSEQIKNTSTFISGLLFILLLLSCDSPPAARKIVNRAIEKHGGKKYKHSRVSFDFRGRHYVAERKGGRFTYIREFDNKEGLVKDILTNEGFTRLLNGDTVKLPRSKAEAYKNSTNSVIYFAFLPFSLNDPSVNKEYIGLKELKGNHYHKIRVTFDPSDEVGEHQDTYIYWFDKDDYSMDYFAYLFHTDGGGIRFRDAKNVREINGIVFADYYNYALSDTTIALSVTDSLFSKGKLELLSEINLKNVKVEILN